MAALWGDPSRRLELVTCEGGGAAHWVGVMLPQARRKRSQPGCSQAAASKDCMPEISELICGGGERPGAATAIQARFRGHKARKADDEQE